MGRATWPELPRGLTAADSNAETLGVGETTVRRDAAAPNGAPKQHTTGDDDDGDAPNGAPLDAVAALGLTVRAMVAAKLATLPLGANQHASIEAPSQSEAADMLNVSRSAVQRAREVQASGAPGLIAAVETGAVSVSAAADVATLPAQQQTEIVARSASVINL